jgi:hypothetical protein
MIMPCASDKESWRQLDRCGDVGDETVASPGNIDDEPIAVASVAQRATQCRNIDREIGRLDKNIGPNASHQFLLADQLAWAFKQDNQDFQSTTSKGHWLVAFQQKKLSWKQPKRSECNFGWRVAGGLSSLLKE